MYYVVVISYSAWHLGKSSVTLCRRNEWKMEQVNECEFWAGPWAGGLGGETVWSLIKTPFKVPPGSHGTNLLFNPPVPADVASLKSPFLDVLS